MNYFYHPEIFDLDKLIVLPQDESHHAMRVLRLGIGDNIYMINGLGEKAEGKIHEIEGKLVNVLLQKIDQQARPSPKISIALGLLKKRDRVEWFIEKAVELAASEIIIFTSEHTEKKNTDEGRLEKITISALKQSGNLWLPAIKTGFNLKQLIAEPFEGEKFIAHCEDDAEKALLKNACKKGEDTLILIGPEGDFSKNEIDLALKNNFKPVSLGDLRLRAETAALMALITLKVINE